MSLVAEIARVLKEDMGINREVTPESRLTDDLLLDSLDLGELVLKLETATGLEIPDDKAAELKTVAGLVAFLEAQGVTSLA